MPTRNLLVIQEKHVLVVSTISIQFSFYASFLIYSFLLTNIKKKKNVIITERTNAEIVTLDRKSVGHLIFTSDFYL